MKSHDMPAHTLSLVIPMYNEVDNVVPMLDRVHEALGNYPHPWELVLVDDGSGYVLTPLVVRAMQLTRRAFVVVIVAVPLVVPRHLDPMSAVA